jgi:putative pyruvate formate lyase activating enzyme
VPAYSRLLESGELERRAAHLTDRLKSCDLCPRRCQVNRLEGELGSCGVGRLAWVSSFGPHHGEEQPLRGTRGSGTVFFSGCNLHCIFCQNAAISQQLNGIALSANQLAEVLLELQARGCHNINLVSPTHVAAQIVQALNIAAGKGLNLPLVYNTGGYDSVETLAGLDGIIDIYMPDMKYSQDEMGKLFSAVYAYPDVNRQAVKAMHEQVGDLLTDSKGIAIKGLLVRHLVLPDGLAGSREILEFLAREISLDTYLNIMDQYHPHFRASSYPGLDRRISLKEYQEVRSLALELGFRRLD